MAKKAPTSVPLSASKEGQLRSFYLPDLGVSVEAVSVEDAVKQATKEMETK